MTSPIRLRQHIDGRLAVFRDGMWLISSVPPVTSYPSWFHDDRLCSGPGWSELLVVELPEPDDESYYESRSDAHSNPSWTRSDGYEFTAYSDGVDIEGNLRDTEEELAEIRSDALKMLAAVAACEQYRAQREMTT